MACMKFSVYFGDDWPKLPCSGKVLVMPRFWLSTPDGKLDAVICEGHARQFMEMEKVNHSKSYLAERIRQLGFSEANLPTITVSSGAPPAAAPPIWARQFKK
jgi:hypothetical protein